MIIKEFQNLKHGKLSSVQSNSGLTSKITKRDGLALELRIVGRKHPNIAVEVTAELNQHLNSPVSYKTVRSDIMEDSPSGNLCFHYQHSVEVEVVQK